jgi:hypothetical protein
MEIKIPYYEDNSRISNSSLGWFKISPKYFKGRLDGTESFETTKAMENGTMTHMYLLQPDEYKKTYKILNFTTPTSPQQKKFCQDYVNSKAVGANLKAAEAFKANYSTTGKTEEDNAVKGLEMALKLDSYIKWLETGGDAGNTITWSTSNQLKITKENVQLHKKASDLLFNNGNSPEYIAQNEFHINWNVKLQNGHLLECKSLIDRLIIDHENKVIKLVDVKTTADVNAFASSFKKYDYGRQMAFYWMAIIWYFDNELKIDISEYKSETYIVAIQNNGNCACRVFSIPEESIVAKTTELAQILSDIDWHMSQDMWDYTKEYYEGDGVESLPNEY